MPALDTSHWQSRLDDLAASHGIVGAVLGILQLPEHDTQPDQVMRVATGVLNANTGRATTLDSLFQVGSITKTFTGTLIMQLVDEGRLDLDATLHEVLPEFKLADPELTGQITVRQLLNHTAGIDGDIFLDTGRGDDALAKYLVAITDALQLFAPGAAWSYSNTGFAILGRIIEVLTHQTWEQALKDRLLTPLGLRHTNVLPEEAILFDVAVGHLSGLPNPKVTPEWVLPRNVGPAGLINTSITDLLTYARMHLCDGVAADGTRVLSAAAAQAMHAFSVKTPVYDITGESWGLSFIRYDWGGAELFGHDGNTLGQSAYLKIYPERRCAVALLTNDAGPTAMQRQLFSEIFAELYDVALPAPLEVPSSAPELDITEWVGCYERDEFVFEILDEAAGPLLRITQQGILAEIQSTPPREYRMHPICAGRYAVNLPEQGGVDAPVLLYQLENGQRYLHFSSRSTPKVD